MDENKKEIEIPTNSWLKNRTMLFLSWFNCGTRFIEANGSYININYIMEIIWINNAMSGISKSYNIYFFDTKGDEIINEHYHDWDTWVTAIKIIKRKIRPINISI